MVAPDPLPIRLVNTVGWRFDAGRRVERLPDGAALRAWALEAGVLSAGESRAIGDAALEAEAARVRALREATHAALLAHVEGRPVPPEALGAIHRAVTDAVRNGEPAPDLPLRWDVDSGGTDVDRAAGRRLALAVAGLLGSAADVALVGRCGNPPCGWLFVDRTRSHTRRWCSDTGCGNRARARRHYARRAGGAGNAHADG
jgi:predicted RNA-binding Zn ribbon-like protein